MTTQAASKLDRLLAGSARWANLGSTLLVFLLLTLIVAMPLGTLILDYWTPKVQSVLGQPAKPLQAKARP